MLIISMSEKEAFAHHYSEPVEASRRVRLILGFVIRQGKRDIIF